MPASARLALFYALLFGGTGVSLPYAALWFSERGLTGADIGVILAAPMLARIVSGPLAAVWADGFRLRRTPLALLALAAVLAYAALAAASDFALLFAAWFVAASCLGAMIPLTDVLTLKRARADGFDFGAPRGVGSLAFIVANVAMGVLLAAGTTDLILVWMLAAAALAGLAAWAVLPRDAVHEGERPRSLDRFAGLGRLVADPVFMTAAVSVGLIQAAHAFYYGFSALVWTQQGLSKTVTGLLWATGVAAEIVFFWFLGPLRARLGPWRLLMIGGIGAVVRWTATAFAPPLVLLWPLQLLHALSFSATFVAGLQILERLAPPQSASAAQTLSSALSAGVLIGLATAVSGPLYDRYGALGYLAMTVMAALGVVGAWRLRPALAASGGVADGRVDEQEGAALLPGEEGGGGRTI